MTKDAIEPKELDYVRHRLPVWIGVSCILAVFVMGFFVVETGIGADQKSKTIHKTPGQYYRASQWAGQLNGASQLVTPGLLLVILLVIFVIIWRYSPNP